MQASAHRTSTNPRSFVVSCIFRSKRSIKQRLGTNSVINSFANLT